jgi:DNA-binding response OmpR family regulator
VNILIVEDDLFYRDMLTGMVHGWGHDVTCSENGRSALEKVFAMDFDLLMLDVFLPDMTAMDLIPRIRVFRPDARVITLTGQSTRDLELKLREQGIAYYMAKPVAASELKSILDHMGRQKTSRPACHPCPPSAAV